MAGGFGLLIALAVHLGRLPYRGVRHDGILYLGQALAHLNPSWAAQDLYFAHGSQDRFSIFSSLVAWGLQHADAGTVDILLLQGACALWVVALVGLTSGLPWLERWLGIFAVMAASHYYGTSRIFGFMEPFVTARTLGEPTALIALVLLLRGRVVPAGLVFVLAMLLHPLIALPLGMIAFAYLVQGDRRWLAALLLAIPVLGLAFAGVAPFAALLSRFDPPWLVAVLWANNIVFESNWHFSDAVVAATNLGIVWFTWRRTGGAMDRLQRAVVLSTVLLCAVSFIGADVLNNVLVTQLQLWRILWLLDVLALVSLPVLVLRTWRRNPAGRIAAVALFVTACSLDAWLPTAWMLACWTVLALTLSARDVPLTPAIVRLAIGATVVVGAALFWLQWLNADQQFSMHDQGMAIAQPSSIPFTAPVVTLPIAWMLLVAWRRGSAMRVLAVVVGVGLFAFTATQWDQRSSWARYLETARPGTHPFAALIPPTAQVYWYNDTAAAWILLQRANFISPHQVAGLLFNRATALTAVQRGPALLGVMGNQERCSSLERLGAVSLDDTICTLPRDAFLNLCSLAPTPADFLVAAQDFGTGIVSRWRFQPTDGKPAVTYNLYDCSKIR